MLDPSEPAARIVAAVALIALVGWLVVRGFRRRREYPRFRRLRSTALRQRTMRRWLLDSCATFGGLAVVGLLVAGSSVSPLLTETAGWPVVAAPRAWLATWWPLALVAGLALIGGLVALTIAGARAARTEGLPAVGDIRALLPRNRGELRWGALLAVNAGVVEELLFRLAVPALLFQASGSALLAVGASLALFAGLHAYQGVAGVVGTAIVGALLTAVWLLSGSVLVAIVLHALFDLRTLVVIPMLVGRVHRETGRGVALSRPAPSPPAA